MIEPIPLAGIVRLADHHLVRARMAGLSLDMRLRALASERFLLLQNEGSVAVFEHNWLHDYTAVVLDIDDPGDFAWEALAYLFENTEARTVRLASADKDAGLRFGAYAVGVTSVANADAPWIWALDKRDFLRTFKERRSVDEIISEPNEAGADERPDQLEPTADKIADGAAAAARAVSRKQREASEQVGELR